MRLSDLISISAATISFLVYLVVGDRIKNKWLKVLFMVCGVPLWVWMINDTLRLAAIANLTISDTPAEKLVP
jgi:bifunctional N-acetylglucosamine-1-phosphate-uridyltransferase/glucosamine-1-phosphate-acetyltransferase GlmU-like protein